MALFSGRVVLYHHASAKLNNQVSIADLKLI